MFDFSKKALEDLSNENLIMYNAACGAVLRKKAKDTPVPMWAQLVGGAILVCGVLFALWIINRLQF